LPQAAITASATTPRPKPVTADAVAPAWGVHSEIGRLHSVIVCRPGLAQLRVTPHSRMAMAFDAVMWVERAEREHAQFVTAMMQHGVEVLELHDLLAQAFALPEARRWAIEQRLGPQLSGMPLHGELQQGLFELSADMLARALIGGMSRAELPWRASAPLAAYLGLSEFVLMPLPNTLFARESSCWIHDGVLLNTLPERSRLSETQLCAAVYRFHPRFASGAFATWWGEGATPAAGATLDGADVMALGDGVVLIGTGACSSPHAVVQLAQALFAQGGAKAVVAAQLPRSHAARHLDTVFTQCSREVVTYCPEVVDRIACHELRPTNDGLGLSVRAHPGKHLLDVLSEVLEVPTLNAIATGDDPLDGGTEQWDDGNNLLALEPGVVIGYERNTSTHRRLRAAGIEVIEIAGAELGRSRAGPHGLACPVRRDAVSYR
jgi:arginine deiminase